MKIESLRLHDFKCFSTLEMSFTKPVNLIFGQNAAGKSTIAQAIELVLTGKINSLTGAKIKNSLVRSGGEAYSVSAMVENHGRNLEMYQNSKERGSEIECDKAVLSCLLDTTRFLSENPNTQKQLLFDLLGLRVDESNLKDNLRNWLKSHPETLARNWRPDGDFDTLINCLEGFPKSLGQGYEAASEERKLVKREMKTFEGTNFKGLPKGISAETLLEQIRLKQEELTELHTKIGEARGLALGEEKSLEAEISGFSGQIMQMEGEIKAFNQAKEQAELDRLLSEKNHLDADLSNLEEELHGLNGEIISLEAINREREALLARLKDFTGLCPLLKDSQYTCQTREVLATIQARKIPVKDNEKIQELRDKKQRLMELIDQKQKLHITIEGGITCHRAGLARLEKIKKDLEASKVKREKLEQVIKSLDGRNKEELVALRDRVKALQSEIGMDQSQHDLVAKATRKLALEEKLGKLEVLAQAFSPKGIMGDLLASATSRLTEETNRIMKQLSGGRYSVEIVPDTFDIYLVDACDGRKTPIPLASESERFRLGMVFQAVLAQLSGFRFMVVDGLDILDQQNRGFFFRFLQTETPRFDQIIALCTIGSYQPKNPGLKDVDFWVIEDGVAKVIPVIKAA